jgi:hypothetical protein
MLKTLQAGARAAHDLVRPYCQKCGKRAFRHRHCDICGGICKRNEAKALKDNYSKYNREDSFLESHNVCDACYKRLKLNKCGVTDAVFFSKDDVLSAFHSSQAFKDLSPNHPFSQVKHLSPDGLIRIEQAHKEYLERTSRWAGCSRQDFLRGFHIIKEIGLIRESGYDDPAEVEAALKRHCLQIGGNGCIKFFWDKHIRHHEEEYVAGHGKKGNPYYRSRHWTTADFSGHAVAVIAEPASRGTGRKKN